MYVNFKIRIRENINFPAFVGSFLFYLFFFILYAFMVLSNDQNNLKAFKILWKD